MVWSPSPEMDVSWPLEGCGDNCSGFFHGKYARSLVAWVGRAARGAFWLRKGKAHPVGDLDIPELAFSSDQEQKIRM